MPFEVNQEELESPSMKILDISKPPMKSIPHREFPKMVYLHPKDKAKQHKTQIVLSPEQFETAERQGYKTTPHIPREPVIDLSEDFEAEPDAEAKRGRLKAA